MRSPLRLAAWTVAVLLGLPVLLAAALLGVANTELGRGWISSLAPRLTGGAISLSGLAGRFPDHLRLAALELRDGEGSYAAARDVVLDWHPLALLAGEAKIGRLAASSLTLLRLPQSKSKTAGSSGALPVRISIDELQLPEIDIADSVAGTPLRLALGGRVDIASMEEAHFALEAAQRDAPGRYRLVGQFDATSLTAHASLDEAAHGPISVLAGLPDLGAISLQAAIEGPRHAERLTLTAAAGALTAQAAGSIDLVNRALDLDVSASAPDMAPSAELAWRHIELKAHVSGPMSAPRADGNFALLGLRASGGGADRVTAQLAGDAGALTLTARVEGLRLPHSDPALLAEPLALSAEMRLDDPARPLRFTLAHPLIAASGKAETGSAVSAEIDLRLQELAPFATAAGWPAKGTLAVSARYTTQGSTQSLSGEGTLALTAGPEQAALLIGDQVRFSLGADLSGQDITLDHLTIAGKSAQASASGTEKAGVADLDWTLTLADVAPLAKSVTGSLRATGKLSGRRGALDLTAEADGDLASPGFVPSPVHVTLSAQDVPDKPSGRITAQGQFDRAPLQLAAGLERGDDGSMRVRIERAEWRSASASGDLAWPAGAALPAGTLRLRVGALGDLQNFLGQKASGSLDLALDMVQRDGRAQARLRGRGERLLLAGSSAQRVTLEGTIDDPVDRPVLNLRLAAEEIAAAGVTGTTSLELKGPPTAVALQLSGRLAQDGKEISLLGTGELDWPRHALRLAAFSAAYAGQTAKLLAPARIDFAGAVKVDRLRLGIDRATLEIAGRLAPTLDLTASARDVTPVLAKPFMPDLAAQGSFIAEARLTGSLAAPEGTIRINGTGLRLDQGAARALPPTSLQASAVLRGGAARLDVRLATGNRAQLAITGQAPLDPTQPLELRSSGSVDLALLDPILAADGRALRGRLAIDGAAAGTLAAPRITGRAQLSNGDIQDYGQGIHISDAAAMIEADGDRLRIQRFTGRAGNGTVAASGTIGILLPGMPVEIQIEAQNARPLQSEIVTATVSGRLAVTGEAQGQLTLRGRIAVARAEITVPDTLPPKVAKLNVRYAGQASPPQKQAQPRGRTQLASAAPAPQRASPSPLALDLTVDAPQQIFVRGRGLDAEMGGSLRITGSSTAPQVLGGFDLRRGDFSIAGQTLTFNRGRVSFEGASTSGKLVPSLNFVAQTSTGGVTATLTITGYADQPKILLTSTPELPQDEILAHLLFGQSVKQLGPFQIAQIAQALAALGGIGGSGSPIDSVRKGLGLDRLNVGGNSTGTGGTVEAGKYVANGIYVGAKQNTSGGTQAQVQIDITKHLKLQTTVGTGGTPVTGATPQNDPGSSIGLTYQFEY